MLIQFITILLAILFTKDSLGVFAASEMPVIINDSGLEFRAVVETSSVGDALKELDIKLFKEDIVLPDIANNLRANDKIFIQRAVATTLTVDGETRNINTHTKTVSELVQEQNIELKELDRVEPTKETGITSGLDIKIIRVEKEVINKEVKIPIQTIVKKDPELSWGKTEVVQEGEAGDIKEEWEITYENNKEIKRKLLKKTTIKEMVSKIISEGTKVEVGQAYFGKASWYVRSGLTAASLQYAKGAKARVTNTDSGASVIVTIDDSGPYVAGRIIDLSDKAFVKIGSLGKGVVNVKVEEIL